jgi:hypothetical protein
MKQQAARVTPIGRDPVLDLMIQEGLPLTEMTYLEMQYPEGIPDPVPPELKAAMPPEVKGRKEDNSSIEGMSTPQEGLVERASQGLGLTPEQVESDLKAFGVF